MTRHTAAIAIVCVLSPSWVVAQTSEFTVSVPSAAVRKAPSLASPAVGQAQRGMVLTVTRDIGAWVKVAWPDAEDGIGYVHQSMGSLSRRATLEERVAAAFPEPAPSLSDTPSAQAVPAGPAAVPLSTRTVYVPPPTHVVGLGARMGGTSQGAPDGFGVTSRIWSRNRFGVQVEAFRSSITSEAGPGRLHAFELAPSLIYSLPDRVGDYVWLRPYLGAGGTFYRTTFKPGTPEANVSDSSFGMRTFGGAEFTFSSVPRLAISADLGYRWSQDTFAGFDLGGTAFSVAAHYYFR
jgi:opacity protein-like surface antigen